MIVYFIRMTARCDGCQRVLDEVTVEKPSELADRRWEWKRKWKARGMMERDRRYGQRLLYCQKCADGAPIRQPAKDE